MIKLPVYVIITGMEKQNKKAVGLISGGLDSVIAMQMLKEQGFEIKGLHILTPFTSGFGEKTLKNLKHLSKAAGFDLIVEETGDEYIEMVKAPLHGYGKNLNPCIDCHIYMLRAAKKIMENEKAEIVFTGEVLGQRGKSQTKRALELIEKKTSLTGKLLRPLSAKLLPATEAEIKGLVDRKRLLSIEGKTRTEQIAIAGEKNLKYYQTPAGGCLLTESSFCKRLSDLIKHKPDAEKNDYLLLQTGRHFRFSPFAKTIIARTPAESKKMLELAGRDLHVLTSPENRDIVALIDGSMNNLALEVFASYISEKETEVYTEINASGKKKKNVRGKNKFEYHKYLI